MQNFFGFKFVSGQMSPKTHCPSMKRPLWYFLFPDALISTFKPALPIGPVWFYIILSAQTSWQYLYQSFYWGGFIFLWGFVHSLNRSVAVRPSVSQDNNFFIGKLTTRKPWGELSWCLSIAIFLRALPKKSSSSLPIQSVFTSLFWTIYRWHE